MLKAIEFDQVVRLPSLLGLEKSGLGLWRLGGESTKAVEESSYTQQCISLLAKLCCLCSPKIKPLATVHFHSVA